MAKNDFQYGGWNSYTLRCGMWLWNHDSEFTKRQHPAMSYVALGWHATEFAQTPSILEFYIWFQFRPYQCSQHVILHQSAKFLSKSDHPWHQTMTSCRFSRWRISAILDFRGLIMGSLKSPCTTSYIDHGSKLLSFWENRVFVCWRRTDRLTDKQTDEQMDRPVAWSSSRCREWWRLNNTPWGKKIAPFYFCNNFVQLHCILINFGTQILK